MNKKKIMMEIKKCFDLKNSKMLQKNLLNTTEEIL